MRRALSLLLLAAVSLGVGALLAEALAQVWVRYVVEQGKLFAPDPVLGWRVLPDLDLVRRNADGRPWRVRTDAQGRRGPGGLRRDADRRVLVLGDSFAFGQGVDVEARFDTRLAEARPAWSIVNLGVMGYGTDQSLLAARPLAPELRRGDTVLLLTYGNDFLDVLRRRFSGRAKPWFERRGAELVLHPPAIGWLEVLRDRSYLVARVATAREGQRRFDADDVAEGAALYRVMLAAESAAWRARGVGVLIAYHGLGALRDPAARGHALDALRRTCAQPGHRCVDLDPALARRGRAAYLADGHWSPLGHAAAAQRIEPELAGD